MLLCYALTSCILPNPSDRMKKNQELMKVILFTASSKTLERETGLPSCECVAVGSSVTAGLLVHFGVPALIRANMFTRHCFCSISPNRNAVKKTYYLTVTKLALVSGSPEQVSGTLMLQYWGRQRLSCSWKSPQCPHRAARRC